ncbi:MAG: hypothetical protein KJ638_00385 [Chloroflexi bacterium]|nr:hypothetical protein [Chloroflexota bacterium]
MNNRFLSLFVGAVSIACLSGSATAATRCARPSTSGSGDGSDWHNAIALSSVVSSPSYRGDTIFISGESYGSMAFDAAESGTSIITIRKATADDHVTDTGWSASWGTTRASFGAWTVSSSYWTIDGQTGGGYGSWTSGHGIYIDSGSWKGIYIGYNDDDNDAGRGVIQKRGRLARLRNFRRIDKNGMMWLTSSVFTNSSRSTTPCQLTSIQRSRSC